MGRLLSAVIGATSTLATAYTCSKKSMPSWQRESFRGTPVSLTGGLALATGTMLSAVSADHQSRLPATIATASGALAGYVDDHLETAFPAQGKGFSGHLGALRDGKITSGLMKIAVVGAGSLVAGTVLSRRASGATRLADATLNTLLIASTANFINLLDVRPGRALKVSAILGAFGAVRGSDIAAGSLGSALTALPPDLSGDTMLGDLGANAIGAQLGTVLASDDSAVVRVGLTGVILALTALSEKYSFSQIIEDVPALKALDELGRP